MLDGIRVVEVGNFMAVPFCGMQLADLGAEVIKVENPRGGDQTRAAGPFLDGESSPFLRLNRGKRSVALDLKTADGTAAFRRLVGTADVVIENLRPGAMDRLGVGYAALAGVRPELVYVAATGFGSDGPYADRAGLDIVAQGMSGLMSVTGEPGGAPMKSGVPLADLSCALYATIAVLAALRARDRDGCGQFVDVSLLESAVSLCVWEAGRFFATGEVPQAAGSAHGSIAPYAAFRASDGWFTFGATSTELWHRTCAVLEIAALGDDPRYATNGLRMQNRDELTRTIESMTLTRPVADWLARFDAAAIPCGPISRFDRVFGDEHLAERGFFVDVSHPTLGPVRQLGSPMRFSGTPVRIERSGPPLGADTADVFREIGLSPGGDLR